MLCGYQPPNPLTDNRLREDIVKELDQRADYESASSGVVTDLLRTGRDLRQKNTGAGPTRHQTRFKMSSGLIESPDG
jgi:hypothetical protein